MGFKRKLFFFEVQRSQGNPDEKKFVLLFFLAVSAAIGGIITLIINLFF